ncbi:transmembrane protein, partial [Trifolium medium]|nr:transmembrane protein [Trifolium medium]
AGMAGTFFRLFVIVLGLSHLLCMTAVPVTRTENLMQDGQGHLMTLENNPKVITERNLHLEEPKPRITERMVLELNDYAPSGANGRHTPRAP